MTLAPLRSGGNLMRRACIRSPEITALKKCAARRPPRGRPERSEGSRTTSSFGYAQDGAKERHFDTAAGRLRMTVARWRSCLPRSALILHFVQDDRCGIWSFQLSAVSIQPELHLKCSTLGRDRLEA
jgi:hypothetical protein